MTAELAIRLVGGLTALIEPGGTPTDPTFDPPGDHPVGPRVLIPGPRTVVPVHAEGWSHLTQGTDDLVAAYADRGLAERLHVLSPGETAAF